MSCLERDCGSEQPRIWARRDSGAAAFVQAAQVRPGRHQGVFENCERAHPRHGFACLAITLSAASPRRKSAMSERSRQTGERRFQPRATVGNSVSSHSVIQGWRTNKPLSAARGNRS
jgi:hypothetical protein